MEFIMSEQEKYYARKNREYKSDRKAERQAQKKRDAEHSEKAHWAQGMY